MKTIQCTFEARTFVVGISNYTTLPAYWSWSLYLGPVFVNLNILKPRRLRRR